MTATSTKSRNFTFGKMFGEKKSKEEIDKYRKETTIEGLYTLESIYKLIKKKKVYMPIIDLIKNIVDGKEEAKALIDLLTSDRVFK